MDAQRPGENVLEVCVYALYKSTIDTDTDTECTIRGPYIRPFNLR